MLQREKYDRGRHSERGAGGKDPEAFAEDGEDAAEDYDLPPIPDDDELDLSWGKAVMPDFSDEPATSLPVASIDNKKIYAAADAVDSTDATVIAGKSKTARKTGGKEDDDGGGDGEKRRPAWLPLAVMAAILILALAAWFIVTSLDAGFGTDRAALVNDEAITLADLDARFESVAAQNPAMFDPEMGGLEEGAARRLILDAMIDDLLLMQEAQRRGVAVDDAAVDEQIDAFVATYPSFEEFEEELRLNNFTLDMLKNQVRNSMALEALLEILVPADSISDEDIRNYYDENIELYTEAAAKRTSHILLPLEDETRATELLAQLRDSDNLEADFARIAEESSADSISAAQGGDAGWPRVPDQRHPDYVRAVDRLDVGELSDLVRTEVGYFIILVTEERPEGVRSFESVAPGILDMLLSTLRNQMRTELLERLRNEATIEILDSIILEFEADQEAPIEEELLEELTQDETADPDEEIDPSEPRESGDAPHGENGEDDEE